MLQYLELKSPFVFKEKDDRWNAVVHFDDAAIIVEVFRQVVMTYSLPESVTYVVLYKAGPHSILSSDGDVFFGVDGMTEARAIAEYLVEELRYSRRCSETAPNLTTVLKKAKKFGPNPTPEPEFPESKDADQAILFPDDCPQPIGKSPATIVHDDQGPIKAAALALKYFKRLIEFQSEENVTYDVISCRKSLEFDGWRVVISYFKLDCDESFAGFEISREDGDLIEFDLFAKIADR